MVSDVPLCSSTGPASCPEALPCRQLPPSGQLPLACLHTRQNSNGAVTWVGDATAPPVTAQLHLYARRLPVIPKPNNLCISRKSLNCCTWASAQQHDGHPSHAMHPSMAWTDMEYSAERSVLRPLTTALQRSSSAATCRASHTLGMLGARANHSSTTGRHLRCHMQGVMYRACHRWAGRFRSSGGSTPWRAAAADRPPCSQGSSSTPPAQPSLGDTLRLRQLITMCPACPGAVTLALPCIVVAQDCNNLHRLSLELWETCP